MWGSGAIQCIWTSWTLAETAAFWSAKLCRLPPLSSPRLFPTSRISASRSPQGGAGETHPKSYKAVGCPCPLTLSLFPAPPDLRTKVGEVLFKFQRQLLGSFAETITLLLGTNVDIWRAQEAAPEPAVGQAPPVLLAAPGPWVPPEIKARILINQL